MARRGGDRGLAHALAQRGGDRGRRRFLDHLLMAALDRAIPLAEMDDVAVLVGEDLDFDVAGVGDRALQDQLARCRRRSSPRSAPAPGLRARSSAEATSRMPRAAAARGGLDHQREADTAAFRNQHGIGLVRRPDNPARRERRRLPSDALAARLVAHGVDRGGRRADEDEAGLGASLRERGILRKEAVAGMDGVGAGAASRRER